MFPVTFTPQTTRDGQPGVAVQIGFPLDRLLSALLASDPLTSPLPAPTAQAVVPGDDVFAQLESEMVSDALAAAQAQRRAEVRGSVEAVLAGAGEAGVDTVVDGNTAQELLEWLNRMYVTLRSVELDADGEDLVVGESQSAGSLLGLEPDPEGEAVLPRGLPTVLLAALVEELHEALEDLPVDSY